MKNKKRVIEFVIKICLMVIVIMISGCGRFQDNNANYRSGNEGITLSFLDFDNREAFVEGEFLNLQVNVENKGSYNYPIGRIFLTGFDKKSIFFSTTEKDIPPLEAKSQSLPVGEATTVIFDEQRAMRVPYGPEYSPIIQTTACFEYETKAFTSACIIPDIKKSFKGRINCKPSTVSLSSQGAPVAVTSVEQRNTQNYMQFIVTINNVGKGIVVNREEFNDCPFNLDHKKINKVKLDMTITGLGQAQCENDNIITLYDGTGIGICKFIVRPGPDYYETPLTINLEYAYTTNIKKQITIANPYYKGTEPEE